MQEQGKKYDNLVENDYNERLADLRSPQGVRRKTKSFKARAPPASPTSSPLSGSWNRAPPPEVLRPFHHPASAALRRGGGVSCLSRRHDASSETRPLSLFLVHD
jgi:hypothetical protein